MLAPVNLKYLSVWNVIGRSRNIMLVASPNSWCCCSSSDVGGLVSAIMGGVAGGLVLAVVE